jgi:hypothetical protein
VVSEDAHVAVVLIGVLVPFWNTAVAVNACVPPATTEAVVGEMVIEDRTGAPTVKVAVPDTPASVAVTVVVPEVSVAATPLLPVAFEIWATAMLLDDHMTWVVTSTEAPLP